LKMSARVYAEIDLRMWRPDEHRSAFVMPLLL